MHSVCSLSKLFWNTRQYTLTILTVSWLYLDSSSQRQPCGALYLYNWYIHFQMIIMVSGICLAFRYIRKYLRKVYVYTTMMSYNMVLILVNQCMQLIPLQFHIQLTAVKTRHPLTSITLTHHRLKYRTHQGHEFSFKVYPWPGYGFSYDRRLKHFHKLLEQATNSEFRF